MERGGDTVKRCADGGARDWRATVLALAAVGAAWLAFRYARLSLSVTAISWGVGAALDPMAKALSRKLGISRRASGLISLFAVALLLICMLAWSGKRLVAELLAVCAYLREGWAGEYGQMLERLLEALPWLKGGERLQAIASAFASHLGNAVARLLAATPRAMLGVVLTLVACIYTSMDYDRLCKGLTGLLPAPWRTDAARIGVAMREGVGKTARAYAILTLIVFGELLLGLSLLGVRSALAMSALIAAVDLLPILGAGTVLLPWAVGALLLGRRALGIGLLVLYAVMVITRQAVTPHLLGRQTGLHPLLSLLAMLLGIELGGVLGMLLAPIVASVLRSLWSVSEPPCDTARATDRIDP